MIGESVISDRWIGNWKLVDLKIESGKLYKVANG